MMNLEQKDYQVNFLNTIAYEVETYNLFSRTWEDAKAYIEDMQAEKGISGHVISIYEVKKVF